MSQIKPFVGKCIDLSFEGKGVVKTMYEIGRAHV